MATNLYTAVPVLSSYSGLMVSETGVDWKVYFVLLGLIELPKNALDPARVKPWFSSAFSVVIWTEMGTFWTSLTDPGGV